jgi:hypothetical protein
LICILLECPPKNLDEHWRAERLVPLFSSIRFCVMAATWTWVKRLHYGSSVECSIVYTPKQKKFRREAEQCQLNAGKQKSPIDREAWLRLVKDWIKLAQAEEFIQILRR